jgi:PPOX class probable FMN-dependent enzyme
MEYVTDLARLQELVGGEPSERSVRKQRDHLDVHARQFLAAAPFCVLSTASATGACDATPRGDEPGFALALDDRTLALPERPGNKRLDSVRNILENPQVGLLFVVPGVTHTLRVNGTARVVADADFFDRMAVYGKPPVLALVVSVGEVYFHCAKAFVRSQLWQPETWPDRQALGSLGRVLRDQVGIGENEAREVDERGSLANRPAMF